MSKQTVNFLDVLLTLLKYKITILTLVVSLTLVALIISLIWPQTFRSGSEIVQVQESGAPSVGGLLQNLAPFNISGGKVGGETILVVLNSQTLRDNLINEFDLFEVYESSIIEEVRKTLNNNLTIEEVREGGFGFNPVVSVKIGVIDKDPERARDMNQFILDELNRTLELLNRRSTTESLTVLESRYSQNISDLNEAEQALNEFQNEYGIIEAPAQIEALIMNLAEIKATITEREVELAVIERNVNPNTSIYRSKLVELEELRSAFQSQVRRSESLSQIEDSYFTLFDMPDLLLDFVRLQREVEIQQRIQETLFPQLEQQRLMQENSGSGIQVVDEPDFPTYKYGPKRAYIVLAGFFFSIFLAMVIVFYKEMTKDPESETTVKIREIKRELLFRKE
ncbi:GNVR domain-containing protein [Rhodohalobacter sp. SW132]|uniref:GumC family protein n=1 Tax=Rhodohalobacter sp. SW132 TaxID=2293433 RepID=UPI001314E495|nr:GNVR domain-containing protein [Rhodohalobacter sp. SW132]